MRVIIVADEKQQQEILLKNTNPDIKLILAEDYSDASIDNYDAIFYLNEISFPQDIKKYIVSPFLLTRLLKH